MTTFRCSVFAPLSPSPSSGTPVVRKSTRWNKTASFIGCGCVFALLLGGCGLENGDFAVWPDEAGADMGSILFQAPEVSQALQTLCPGGETLPGIDVSYYQGVIDWEAVANDGIVFAISRVSDGPTHIDTQFQNNWQGSKANGLIRGAYQFFRSNRDPVEQADHLLDVMGPLEAGDLPPVLDLESTDGVSVSERIQNVRTWLDRVESAVGMPPIIYTGGYFWNSHMSTTEFSDHPLWHAGYTGGDCPTTVANEWNDWTFWQYTSSGSVAGISGNVDRNHFNGNLDDLMALTLDGNLCGNGICGVAESHESCPVDCPGCEALPEEGGVISEDGPCFLEGGPIQYLRKVNDAGEGGELIWTHTTNRDDEVNFGRWQVQVSTPGYYRIEAYTSQAYAESQQARYLIRHHDEESIFVINQAEVDGWSLVANRLWFSGDSEEYVHLGDNTGEPTEGQVRLVFDAIRVTRHEDQSSDMDTTTDNPAPADNGAAGDDVDAGLDVRPSENGDSDANPQHPADDVDASPSEDDDRLTPWSAADDSASSCEAGCQSTGELPSMWVLVLALLRLRRNKAGARGTRV